MKVMNVNILELVVGTALNQSLDQALGCACYRAQMDVIARLNNFHRLFGGGKFDLVVHFIWFTIIVYATLRLHYQLTKLETFSSHTKYFSRNIPFDCRFRDSEYADRATQSDPRPTPSSTRPRHRKPSISARAMRPPCRAYATSDR